VIRNIHFRLKLGKLSTKTKWRLYGDSAVGQAAESPYKRFFY